MLGGTCPAFQRQLSCWSGGRGPTGQQHLFILLGNAWRRDWVAGPGPQVVPPANQLGAHEAGGRQDWEGGQQAAGEHGDEGDEEQQLLGEDWEIVLGWVVVGCGKI